MADVQRSRGIRRDELHVDGTPAALVAPPIRLVRGDDRGDATRDNVDVDAKVDEPWAGDLRRTNAGALEVERVDDRLREVTRLALERLGKNEGDIRRPIAEGRIARPLDCGLDVLGRAKGARRARELGAKQIGVRHQVPELEVPDEGFGGFFSAVLVSAGFDSAA